MISRTPNLTWGDLRRLFRSWSRSYCRSAACWRIDGRPVCGLLNITDFVHRYGVATFEAMIRFAGAVVEAEIGTPPYLVGVIGQADPLSVRIANRLPLDALTGYALLPNWLRAPVQDYAALAAQRVADWYELQRRLRIPFYPVVSAGWDATPRAAPGEPLRAEQGYPLSPVVTGVTPERFGAFLDRALEFNRRFPPRPNIVFVHAWNEWSEASVLEPSDRFGVGFLEEIRRRATARERLLPFAALEPAP